MQRKRKSKQSGVHATKIWVVPNKQVDNPALLLHRQVWIHIHSSGNWGKVEKKNTKHRAQPTKKTFYGSSDCIQTLLSQLKYSEI